MSEPSAEELLSLNNEEQKLWVFKQDWYLEKQSKINLMSLWPHLQLRLALSDRY